MRKLIPTAALAATLLATPVAAAFPSGASCIRQDDINNWTSLNDKQIVLENLRHRRVLLKLIGTCSGFRFHENLVIRSPGATGLSCVSPGDSIITRNAGMGGRCTVISVEPYNGPMKPPADTGGH
ncbi:MAG: DUF6491 family protein [Rhizomicrobium sp.]